ncbi:MAG TPA: FAD-linked oxidase C-terminal domain-containing protein, partial [Candidatus Paceibacterota bacterium]|nr:FAD-linked oxidase C-terminal domain-containing protein [Candidatus Paceibacterota bacterium]
FNLLRHKVKGLKTAPFIDDIIVRPEYLNEFLPHLYRILNSYGFLYTVAGHVGDGNFHIIPLIDFNDKSQVASIPRAADEVYNLVLRYGGSITAEHNDGLIRGSYLKRMYGAKIYNLMRQVKKIFDPQGIFNPGKKIGTESLDTFLYKHLRK